jgi:hypothetical protein
MLACSCFHCYVRHLASDAISSSHDISLPGVTSIKAEVQRYHHRDFRREIRTRDELSVRPKTNPQTPASLRFTWRRSSNFRRRADSSVHANTVLMSAGAQKMFLRNAGMCRPVCTAPKPTRTTSHRILDCFTTLSQLQTSCSIGHTTTKPQITTAVGLFFKLFGIKQAEDRENFVKRERRNRPEPRSGWPAVIAPLLCSSFSGTVLRLQRLWVQTIGFCAAMYRALNQHAHCIFGAE